MSRDCPNLARMAFDVFSIPAMSAEVERIFLAAGHLVTDERNSLGEEVIEAPQCQKH
jgi:hAT family C-terminal dimerisation region